MMKSNKTYKQKIGSALIGTGRGIGWVVATIAFTAVILLCTLGKKALEQGEKLAEKGQTYSSNKVVQNFVEVGNDTKEAYNLYQQKEVKTESTKEVDLIDEGYSSGSEKVIV